MKELVGLDVVFFTKLVIISTFCTSVSTSWQIPRNPRQQRLLLTDYYRLERSAEIAKSIANGALYSIKNLGDGLHLTAKSGRTTPGPVISKKWQDAPAQLWEVNKLETSQGYSLKPLHNEFNSITSQLTGNTHSYHSWEFKNTREGNWMIHNVLENKCIRSNGNTQTVTHSVCNPKNRSQLWEFMKIE